MQTNPTVNAVYDDQQNMLNKSLRIYTNLSNGVAAVWPRSAAIEVPLLYRLSEVKRKECGSSTQKFDRFKVTRRCRNRGSFINIPWLDNGDLRQVLSLARGTSEVKTLVSKPKRKMAH